MEVLIFKKKKYPVDPENFLLNHDEWDETFAEGLAPSLKIACLSGEHWKVIHFIRDTFRQYGKCPLVYETCKANKLRLKDLQQLFPTGYLRGACKLAGVTYKEAYHGSGSLPPVSGEMTRMRAESAGGLEETAEKTYRVDVRGFLMNPYDWDELYALCKAKEMGMPDGLSERHWEIIRFLRAHFKKNNVVPSVYETCEANGLEIEDLEKFFPLGYHRSAVKIAGLRAR